MPITTSTHRTLLALVAALVLLVVAADPAPAKSPPDRTGVFSGELHHVSDGVEFDTDIVLTIARSKGAIRLASIAATVRTYCPDPAVSDIRLLSVGPKGPRVDSKGRFTLKRQGVVLTGRVAGKRITGTVTASVGDCTLPTLDYTAKKRVV